jgi:DNA-binding PadR family transcriptional regulator
MSNPFTERTELLILRMLRDACRGIYGLELVKASDGALMRGTIYITLGRLEEKGYVQSRLQADADHPDIPRPIYKITALGERALAEAELSGWNLAGA